ncbi:MAG TPA: hypothetical protein VMS64_21215 [Candidatus Methylomirabilis sp.]|nr:hypothetical protein [Candidatus Methylomirabilis sp.]
MGIRALFSLSLRCRLSLSAAVVLFLLMGSATGSTPPPARAQPDDDRGHQSVRGTYLYSEHPDNAQDMANVLQALSVPGVDGLTLLVGWSSVEPQRGVFS